MAVGKRVYEAPHYFKSLNRLELFEDFADPAVLERADACWAEVLALLGEVQRCASLADPSSDLARFNKAPVGEKVAVSSVCADLVECAQRASRVTRGVYDPSAGVLVDLWGFSPATAGARVPERADVEAAQGLLGAVEVVREPAAGEAASYRALVKRVGPASVGGVVRQQALDLGGIAKGWVVDRVACLLAEHGFAYGSYSCASSMALLKSAGAVARKRGDGRFNLFLADPSSEAVGTRRNYLMVPVADRCVATSGGYGDHAEVGGVQSCHLIDPRTGCPAGLGWSGGQVRAEEGPVVETVTLLGPEAALGDALATALCIMGLAEAVGVYHDALAQEWDLAMLVRHEGGRRLVTSLRPGSYHVLERSLEVVRV